MGLYWDNGKENGNYYSILGLCRDTGQGGSFVVYPSLSRRAAAGTPPRRPQPQQRRRGNVADRIPPSNSGIGLRLGASCGLGLRAQGTRNK